MKVAGEGEKQGAGTKESRLWGGAGPIFQHSEGLVRWVWGQGLKARDWGSEVWMGPKPVLGVQVADCLGGLVLGPTPPHHTNFSSQPGKAEGNAGLGGWGGRNSLPFF